MEMMMNLDELLSPIDLQIEIQYYLLSDQMNNILYKYKKKDLMLSPSAKSELINFCKQVYEHVLKSLSKEYIKELKKVFSNDGISSYVFYKVRNLILTQAALSSSQ